MYDRRMRALGVDIGGTSIKMAVLGGETVEWTCQSIRYSRPTSSDLIQALSAAASQRLSGLELNAIGLCVPGLLDAERKSVTLSVNVPGLCGLPFSELIQAGLGVQATNLHVVNDALAAGIDVVREQRLSRRVICIALGTGVGMAVLDDGKPLRVDGDSPGHLGQIDVSLPGEVPVGPDGGAGSLEAYLGVPALTQRYGTPAQFLNLADINDPPIRALIKAIRIGHAIYRPDHIALVGGIGIRLKRLLPALKQAVDHRVTSVAKQHWLLHCGTTDFHAAIGAARLAMSAA